MNQRDSSVATLPQNGYNVQKVWFFCVQKTQKIVVKKIMAKSFAKHPVEALSVFKRLKDPFKSLSMAIVFRQTI
jgi:hypothetical protein